MSGKGETYQAGVSDRPRKFNLCFQYMILERVETEAMRRWINVISLNVPNYLVIHYATILALTGGLGESEEILFIKRVAYGQLSPRGSAESLKF